MKITGMVCWVQENKLSEKFYKKLGFTVEKSADDHSAVVLSDFRITLVNMREDEEFARDTFHGDKGRGMYLYIRVDDVDKVHTQFIKAGLKPFTKPRDWSWGNREFVIKDPDGYKLCFWQTMTH